MRRTVSRFLLIKSNPKMHGDAASRSLDSMTLEQHLMEAYGLSQETVRTYLSPISGGGSGLGADALSGYCEYAADVLFRGITNKARRCFLAVIPG